MTRKPVIRVHTKLIATLFCPIWLTTSLALRPFLESETVTSEAVPVRDPSGSPLARASAAGVAAFLRSASVKATGGGAFAEAAAAAGAGGAAAGWALGAWARQTEATHSVRIPRESRFIRSLPLPQRVF